MRDKKDASMDERIAVIGGGNMGSALVGGLVKNKIVPPGDVLVCEIDANRREHLRETYGVEVSESLEDAPGFAKILLLAVKPIHLTEVGNRLRDRLTKDHLVVSILAGQSRAKLSRALGGAARMVRVMPNLPAQAGAGISAVTFGEDVDCNQRVIVNEILSAVGSVVEVEEELQNAVTAVSGSGPGFLFQLASYLIEAAKAVQLPEPVARQLVVQTMLGTARFLEQSGDHPAELVKKVATPGGTTEAGLKVLEQADLEGIIRETIRAATERSKELGRK